ncbi:transposase [Streptomyces qaidamensis]|uniref:IS110 family transposase n=1 Tax=Streptomyces qaidamensis TaxID=1783515 RepID=UPI0036E77105
MFGGVDSHADTVHVAVISDNGGHLADAEFTTTAAGYAAALAFLSAHDHVRAIGVEGTASYGAGFTRAARSHGHQVIEVNRPDRAERRRIGKSDPIDAYVAARAALSGRAQAAPKDETVAGIRALHNAARSAVKARTAALNQITHTLITAPESIRARYGQLKGTARTDALARLRPTGDVVHVAVLTALKSLARRVKELTAEHNALTKALDSEVTTHNRGLRAAHPHRRRAALRSLAHHHFQSRKRTQKGRRPRPRLPRLAPSRLTAIGASSPPRRPGRADTSGRYPCGGVHLRVGLWLTGALATRFGGLGAGRSHVRGVPPCLLAAAVCQRGLVEQLVRGHGNPFPARAPSEQLMRLSAYERACEGAARWVTSHRTTESSTGSHSSTGREARC